MISLPNGCWCSGAPGDPAQKTSDTLSVVPADWNKKGVSVKEDWYIQYWFHDPSCHDPKWKKGKLCIVKGMNRYKILSERRDATKYLIENELELLKKEGYNPITGASSPEIEQQAYEIDPSTHFLKALQRAKEKLGIDGSTARDMKSVLTGVEKAAYRLRIDKLAISEIRRKHIKYLLEDVAKHNPKFSGHGFNKYRSYLMSLFAELVELEAVEANPLKDMKKRKVTKKIRVTLTNEERILIDGHLKNNYYTFWRFMQVFFHSGGREIELLQVKVKDVDLVRFKYKSLIKKGREYKEVERTIKNIALPFWEESMQDAKAEDYVFSVGLIPGQQMIARDQITRRWREHVKKKLGIKADFYALKHLNTSEVVDMLDEQDAAALNAHTSSAMVISIYDVKQKDRQHERLKKLNNSFCP